MSVSFKNFLDYPSRCNLISFTMQRRENKNRNARCAVSIERDPKAVVRKTRSGVRHQEDLLSHESNSVCFCLRRRTYFHGFGATMAIHHRRHRRCCVSCLALVYERS